jgi:hypothetical protein
MARQVCAGYRRFGDTGTIVCDDGGDVFQAESVNVEGLIVWLAEFHRTEIEHLRGEHIEWGLYDTAVERFVLEHMHHSGGSEDVPT